MPKIAAIQIIIIRYIRILEKRLVLQLSCLLIDINIRIAYKNGIERRNFVIFYLL